MVCLKTGGATLTNFLSHGLEPLFGFGSHFGGKPTGRTFLPINTGSEPKKCGVFLGFPFDTNQGGVKHFEKLARNVDPKIWDFPLGFPFN